MSPFKSAWALFWNTIAGWAERAWNAVTAVWAFFVAAGKWLATAFMSYVKGLTTGDWTDFQNNVLKPLRKALEAVISFILDLVRAVFKPISDAIAAFLRALANGVLNVWARVIDEISKANPSAPYHGGVAGAILSIVLFGGGIIAIYAFCLGLAYAGVIAKPWYFVMGLIVAVLIGSIVFGVMDLLHAGYPAPTPQANNALYDPKFGPEAIVKMIPQEDWWADRAPIAFLGLLVTVANFGYIIQHGFNALGLAGFAFALIGFGLFVAGRFASSKISAEMLTMIGLLVTTIGVVLGLVGAIRKAVDDPFLSAFSVLIAVISVWTGFMSFNRIV